MAGSERKIRFYAAMFAVSLVLVGLVAMPAIASTTHPESTCGTKATITLDPTFGDAGSDVVVNGSGFCTGTTAAIRFKDAEGFKFLLLTSVPIADDGTFSVTVTIPNEASIGLGTVNAPDRDSGQCPRAPFEVTAPG